MCAMLVVGIRFPSNEDLVAYLDRSKAFLVVTLIYNRLWSFSLIVLPTGQRRYGALLLGREREREREEGDYHF